MNRCAGLADYVGESDCVCCAFCDDEWARARRWKKKKRRGNLVAETAQDGEMRRDLQLADVIDDWPPRIKICHRLWSHVQLVAMRDPQSTVRAIEFYSGIGVFRSRISSLGFTRLLRRSPFRTPSQRYFGRDCCCNSRLRLGPDRTPSVRCKPWRGHCPQGQSLPGRPS